MRDEKELQKELDFLLERRKEDEDRIKEIVFNLQYQKEGVPEMFPYKKILREEFKYVV